MAKLSKEELIKAFGIGLKKGMIDKKIKEIDDMWELNGPVPNKIYPHREGEPFLCPNCLFDRGENKGLLSVNNGGGLSCPSCRRVYTPEFLISLARTTKATFEESSDKRLDQTLIGAVEDYLTLKKEAPQRPSS